MPEWKPQKTPYLLLAILSVGIALVMPGLKTDIVVLGKAACILLFGVIGWELVDQNNRPPSVPPGVFDPQFGDHAAKQYKQELDSWKNKNKTSPWVGAIIAMLAVAFLTTAVGNPTSSG